MKNTKTTPNLGVGEKMGYKREYCCSNCGLIWFQDYQPGGTIECPECNKNNRTDRGIYACDTMGYAYATKAIEMDLKESNKEIHYAKDHPYYDK